MPIAVAIGGQPVIPIVSCVQIPPHVSEAEVGGGLQNAPIPLVRGETVDLDVPASAEIVLEGEVLPHERMVEGPFGEYMGYEAGKSSPQADYEGQPDNLSERSHSTFFEYGHAGA